MLNEDWAGIVPVFGLSQDDAEEAPTIDAARAAEHYVTPHDLDEQDWRDWFASLSVQQRGDHRDDIVVSGMHAGLTLQALGDLYQVTRERIRQIANAKGVETRTRKLMRYAAEPDGSWDWAEQVLAISPQHEPRNIVTHEECLAALRRVAEMSRGPLTVTTYEAIRDSDEPGARLIHLRCGSWIKALHLAGLGHRMSGKALGRVARGEVSFE